MPPPESVDGVQVDEVGADGPAFDAWFAVLRACELHDRPDEPGYLPEEVRAEVREGSSHDPDVRRLLLSATVDGEVVGAARTGLPRRDNPHLAELELFVLPSYRRRGIARALLQHLDRVWEADGRTTVIGYADEPPGRPSAMTLGAGEALGFALEQSEVRRDVDLPLDPARVAALEAQCAPYADGYDVVTWRAAVPEPLLDDLAVLHARMSTDVPLADLDIAPEVFNGARVRRHEQLAVASGRAMVGAGAVHRATGRMVAYTDQAVPLAAPSRAYQWNTIVLAEHRGHRLGTLVKLAALQRLSAEVPQVRVISTWNAAENEAMIRVNDALGARVDGAVTAWQRRD